jgi:hypothetical protein
MTIEPVLLTTTDPSRQRIFAIAMQLDRPTMLHNPTRKPTRYVVVMASEIPARR